MIRRVAVMLVGGLCLVGAPAVAQESGAWPARSFVNLDVPFQPLSNDFSESVRFADVFARTEQDAFDARYASTRGALFEIGAGVRLAGNIGVGATGSWFRRSGDATFALAVPNPTVANTPRQLSGTVSGLRRLETALHLQALYPVRLGTKASVMLSAGPSLFTVTQDLVKSIEFDEGTGFGAITLGQTVTTQASDTRVGFNVGADVTWPLASHVAVGSVVRYSRAPVALDPGASTPSLTRSVEMHAGGLHVGAGIRLLF